jgi:hypothetical protein
MGTRGITALLIGAITGSLVSLAPLRAAPAQDARSFARELLAAHNLERDRMKVPLLTWSQELARDAQDWAENLARKGRMEHTGQAQRKSAGENLWMGQAGYFGPRAMVETFLDERRHFRPGEFPNVSRTGRWQDVGHYTQIIWANTREVGCAVAKGRQNDFLVCRYRPGGNWIGQNVGG